jgi:hypothetical protein
VVIYMNQYKAARAMAVGALKNGTSGGASRHAYRAPAAVYPFRNDLAQCALSPDFPEDLTTVDMDIFLGKVYALATQI